MNYLLMLIAAGAALGTAGTASAQYSGLYGYSPYGGSYSQTNDWSNRSRNYASFERQHRHTIDGIRHGLSDGTYSRSRANEFYRELQGIKRAAYLSQQYGNYSHEYVQARMARLHQRMHLKHERSHDRNDGYGGYDARYDGGQFGYRIDERRDHDDDHDDDER